MPVPLAVVPDSFFRLSTMRRIRRSGIGIQSIQSFCFYRSDYRCGSTDRAEISSNLCFLEPAHFAADFPMTGRSCSAILSRVNRFKSGERPTSTFS